MSQLLIHVNLSPQLDMIETAPLADLGFDSFSLLRALEAVDELGVYLDEDVFVRVTTLRELYDEYVIAAAVQLVPSPKDLR